MDIITQYFKLSLPFIFPSNAGLLLIISSIAVLISRDSEPSGATEQNLENLGSMKKSKIKEPQLKCLAVLSAYLQYSVFHIFVYLYYHVLQYIE